MEWSAQQAAALSAVNTWFHNKKGNQIFRLFGYAGTGKTTLAKHFAKDVMGQVTYLAYTGKAALEMRKKGCDDATTIHSAIYRAIEDPVTGIFEFELNRTSDIAYSKLIIVDEVSFVGETLAKDLMSFGIKILVLGDPAQLPPIGEDGYFINSEPDYFLTEIHRQAQDNPIIWMSMQVREGKILKPGDYGSSKVVLRKEMGSDFMQENALSVDQVICGLNKTRAALNKSIRRLRGLVGTIDENHPVVGDKLICLRNNRQKGFLNGGMWEVVYRNPTFSEKPINHLRLQIKSEDDPRLRNVIVKVLEENFFRSDSEIDWKIRKKYDDFTFGQAITCHKAQGSQWDKVMGFDESYVFGENQSKWLYTMITRTAEDIIIVK